MSEPIQILLINLGLTVLFFLLLYRAFRVLQVSLPRLVTRKAAATNTQTDWLATPSGFNPENAYWVIQYDCRRADVEIKGLVPRARYWSIIPYDWHTLPLNNYLFDETVETDADGTYTVYLTTRQRNRRNEIDVSVSPQGFVLIRITLPENREVVATERPTARPIARR